jgi:hypothetical protein
MTNRKLAFVECKDLSDGKVAAVCGGGLPSWNSTLFPVDKIRWTSFVEAAYTGQRLPGRVHATVPRHNHENMDSAAVLYEVRKLEIGSFFLYKMIDIVI